MLSVAKSVKRRSICTSWEKLSLFFTKYEIRDTPHTPKRTSLTNPSTIFINVCFNTLLALMILAPVGLPSLAHSTEPLEVFVSILPQKFMVDQVGRDKVHVSVLVGPGQSPATYEPTPKQMSRLQQASVYFRIGVPFEQEWMARLQSINPHMKVLDTWESVWQQDPSYVEKYAKHCQAAHDPHVWTSPPLVKMMARHIRETLAEWDPAHAQEYEANNKQFAKDLDQLDADIRQILAPITNREFMVFHPSWCYFAETYGLEQISIETEGKEPGPKTLARIIERGKREGLKVIFVQPQFSRQTARAIARAIGATIVPVDPLAENYLGNLRHVAKQFAEAMR